MAKNDKAKSAADNLPSKEGKDYGKFVKVMQCASGVFMVAMLIACVILLKKYDISWKNVGNIAEMIPSENTWLLILGICGFSVIKSFALVFPPAVLFILSGMLFENIWVAILVNLLATTLSLVLPYYLGKFTGKPMLDSLKKKFKKIEKLDDFAEQNDFNLVLIIKGSGVLPCDLSSLIFGSLNIGFGKYMTASTIGMVIINVLWTLFGAFGDPNDPLSVLWSLPPLAFAILGAVFIKVFSSKKNKS